MAKKSNVSFQKSIFNLLEELTGNSNVLTSPYVFLKHFNGDHAKTMFFSQLLYWCDKGNRSDGWFYKSYDEWEEELFLTPYQIRKYTKELKQEGLIQTKIKKANNKTTVHYFVCREALFHWVVKNFNISGSEKISQPITETTTEITNKVRNKGIFKENSMHFSTFTAKYFDEIENPDEIIPAVEYYLERYEGYMGQHHPALKVKQWQTVVSNILALDEPEQIGLEDIEIIIDKHFVTEYENCDYNILHFVNGDIIKHRFFEECL